MDNFEKNIEKNISPEIQEKSKEMKREVSLEQEDTEIIDSEEGKSWPSTSSILDDKEKPAQSNKISPIISKKMQYFLDMAEEKGLEAAIKAVEKEKDPLLLDSLHDALAKNKLFEEIFKKPK